MFKKYKYVPSAVMSVFLIQIAFVIFCIVGYAQNIYKLSECDFEAPYKAEVFHAVGLIPVVGIFTGYMDLGK